MPAVNYNICGSVNGTDRIGIGKMEMCTVRFICNGLQCLLISKKNKWALNPRHSRNKSDL
jgi:hypothetical protein